MKIILDHKKVYTKLDNRQPVFMFEKEDGHPIRRRSKYSFIYKEMLYDIKHNITKEWV
jgi:hypothetical protein